MPTPICPRTIGPTIPYRDESPGLQPITAWDPPDPRPCLGSRCAACVEVARPADMDMATFNRHRLVRCGLVPGGWQWFPDPAADPAAEEVPRG